MRLARVLCSRLHGVVRSLAVQDCVGLGKRRSSHWRTDIRSNYDALLLTGHFFGLFRNTAEKEIELDLVRPRLQSVSC